MIIGVQTILDRIWCYDGRWVYIRSHQVTQPLLEAILRDSEGPTPNLMSFKVEVPRVPEKGKSEVAMECCVVWTTASET